MPNKYRNEKVTINGQTFDSKKEARRYFRLRADESQGIIRNLRRQVVYELIPKQELHKPRQCMTGKGSRLVEMPVTYVADFVYEDAKGETVVEDVKSPITRTSEYILKRKLMLYIHNIQISEV